MRPTAQVIWDKWQQIISSCCRVSHHTLGHCKVATKWNSFHQCVLEKHISFTDRKCRMLKGGIPHRMIKSNSYHHIGKTAVEPDLYTYQLNMFQLSHHQSWQLCSSEAALGSWPQPSYLNSKLFGLWDLHLTENGPACLHTYGEKQLLANYNFFHWKTRHWHVERTAMLKDSFGIVCLFSCYLRGNPYHFQVF